MATAKHTELVNHAWSVADLLRGDFKQSEYGKVVLPFTLLRIGMLLLSGGDKGAAEDAFEALYQDHLVLDGPDDEGTREIAEILARLRLSEE